MRIRINKLAIILIMVLIVIAVYLFNINHLLSVNTESGKNASTLHPIYSEYKFTQAENVIKIGLQPLYHPTGLIFEVVKRDNLLKQALAESGMTIEYYNFFKGDDVNHFMNLNQLDAGIGGDMPAISAASKIDVTIPLIVQHGFDSIITGKLMVAGHLRGKKIGYPFGSISHYTLLNTLYSAGISEDEVELIPLEINELSNALYTNKIDAFCAWEPIATEALREHPKFFRNFQNTTSGYMYFKSEFASKYQLETKLIIAAVIRALGWLKSDIENLSAASNWNLISSERFSGKNSVLTAKDLANLALLDILQLLGTPSINPEDLEARGKLYEEYQFLLKLNKIPAETEWEKVKNSFNSKMFRTMMTNRKQFMLDEYDYDLNLQ